VVAQAVANRTNERLSFMADSLGDARARRPPSRRDRGSSSLKRHASARVQ
jgi:hypothetical protein